MGCGEMQGQAEESRRTGSPRGIYRCSDVASREMFLNALTALFCPFASFSPFSQLRIAVAVVAKDLRCEALGFFNAIVRQLTIQAIFEQSDGRLPIVPVEIPLSTCRRHLESCGCVILLHGRRGAGGRDRLGVGRFLQGFLVPAIAP